MQTIAGQFGAFAAEKATLETFHRAGYSLYHDADGNIVAVDLALTSITTLHNLVLWLWF